MAAVAAVVLTGCKDYEADKISSDPVKVDLAFAFSPSVSGSQTRQDNSVVQNTNHDILIQHIIPMIDNEPQEESFGKQETLGKTDAQYFHYGYCTMMPGVNRCLVYGKENTTYTTLSDYATYGCLRAPDPWPAMSLGDISFEPVSIYSGTDVPTGGDPVAAALTAIAKTEGWRTSTNAVMKNLFQNFINHGYNLPGSAASARQWMLALKKAANDAKSSVGEDSKAILDQIITNVDTYIPAEDENGYPRSLNLPDGAAALRWVEGSDESETGFKQQLHTTTLDNINSVSRFAFPASLYYFIKSDVSTSNTMRKFDDYKNEGTWTRVLGTYFNNGSSVTSTTKSVAVTSPVEYAVAQLKVTIKASATLQDASTTPQSISIGETSTLFPLKGVIVCGQRPVDYEFKQADKSDANVKFIYDSQVNSQVNADCYLTTTETDACQTLVLQSYDGEDVNIILEFENKGQSFKCVDGTVYPDTRFYLIGTVAAGSGTGADAAKGRVFTKDYITTVNMEVKSLSKAYNVLPNLLTSNLEIGVMTTPDWIAATPTGIRLDDK